MKRSILFAAFAGMMLAGCKKDRVCSCTEQKDWTPATIPGYKKEYDYTIKESSRRDAYNACAHTVHTGTGSASSTYTLDIYCKLK